MIESLSLRPDLLDALGWALVHAVWQGAAIAAALALALRLSRPSPALRYALACGALAAMLAAPVLTFIVLSASADRALASGNASRTAIAAPSSPAAPVATAPRAIAAETSSPMAIGEATTAKPLSRLGRWREALTPAMPTLVWLWMAGLVVGILRVGGGLVFAGRLRWQGTRPLPAEWMQTVERLARRFGLSRPIAARASTRVGSPSVIGWVRPVLLVPAAALAGLSPQQLEAVLAHELAHIRRHDYLVNLLQMVAETVLFYHPAVWYVSGRVRDEREHCCDDLAVAACGDAVVYASALAELERLRLVCAPALALTATRGPLLRRIERLLEGPVRGSAPAGGALAIVAACTLAAGAGLLAWSPTTTHNNERVQDQPPVAAAPAASTPAAVAPDAPVIAAAPVAASTPPARARAVASQATTPVAARPGRDDQDWWWAPPAPPAPPAPAAPPAPPAPVAAAAPAAPVAFALPPAPPRPVAPPAAAAPVAQPAPPAPPARVAWPRWSSQPAPPAPSTPPAPAAPPTPPAAQAPAAPAAPPAPPAPPAPDSSDSFSVQSHNGDININWTRDNERLRIRANGDIVLNDNDTDITQIVDGDRFDIEERRDGDNSRVEIRTNADGRLERRWWKDGREAAYEPEGRTWLARRLPDIVRRTGLGADRRVARILAKSGPGGVLDEVSLIPSDFVKGRYLTKLLATTTLEPAMLERLIDQSGRELKSDFELGRVLTTVAKRGLPNDRLRLTYVRATTSIGSAFETGRSLGALVAAGPNSGEVSAAIVRRGAAIGSDFELSRLLVAVLGTPGGRDTLEGPLFEALATLGSDFERGRVLTTVCKLPDLTPGAQLAVLDATRKTGSSFEAARILTTLIGQQRLTEPARARFLEVAQGLGSDFERDRVLARFAVSTR